MANEHNLIPVTKRTPSEQRAISAKGGRATRGIPRYGMTTCKMCKLSCPYKEQGKKEGSKCQVPDIKRKILEAALDPSKLTESLFDDVFRLQLEGRTFKEKKDVYYAKLNLKKEVAPTPVTNLHGIQGEIKIRWVKPEDEEVVNNSKQ